MRFPKKGLYRVNIGDDDGGGSGLLFGGLCGYGPPMFENAWVRDLSA